MFLIVSLFLIMPVFGTVSFLDFGPLNVNEGENFVYQLPINNTDLNGSLQCSVNLTPQPQGQYFVIANSGNCTFYFNPTYDDAGNYVANFTIADDNSSDTKAVTLTVNNVNRAPVFVSSPKTSAYVNETYTYDANANDPDGDTLVYFLENPPQGMIINSTTGVITWLPTQLGDYNVTVKVTDGINATTQSFVLKVVKKTYIDFERVKVEVDGDSETLSDGETFEAKPDSKLDFSFKIRNVHPDRLDLQNVYAEVYIRGIDGEDKDDLYEESDEIDLDYNDYDTLEVSLDVPLQVEDGYYDVDVYMYGRDEANVDFVEERHYTLKIKKDRYAVYLKNFELFPAKITCSGSAELVGKIYNIGRNDLDLKVTVTNEDLGLNYQKIVSLDSNPFNEDNDFSLDVPIYIDSAKETKDYRIILKVTDDNDEVNVVRFFTLSVVKCEETTQTQEQEENDAQSSEVEVNVGQTAQSQPTQQPETTGQQEQIIYEQPFTESPLFIVMLGGVFLLLLVLVLVLVILLIKK